MVASSLSKALNELNRSLLNMIGLQVEDVPPMKAVRSSIFASLILRNPRSLLRLPLQALHLPLLCLPPLPLLVVVAEVPVVLAVEAVVTLTISLCLSPLPAEDYLWVCHVVLSCFHARSSKSNAGNEGQGKQEEQLHCSSESLRETSAWSEELQPFYLWPASADAPASWTLLHQAMGTGDHQLSDFWQLENHSYCFVHIFGWTT